MYGAEELRRYLRHHMALAQHFAELVQRVSGGGTGGRLVGSWCSKRVGNMMGRAWDPDPPPTPRL